MSSTERASDIFEKDATYLSCTSSLALTAIAHSGSEGVCVGSAQDSCLLPICVTCARGTRSSQLDAQAQDALDMR
jgi:hypothetical protein